MNRSTWALAMGLVAKAAATDSPATNRAEPFLNTKSGLVLRLVRDPGFPPYLAVRLSSRRTS